MKEYLKQVNERNRSNHFMWLGGINVYNSKELPEEVNMDKVLEKVGNKVPPFLLSNIESIIIGNRESMREREVDAMYEDGAIYIFPDFVQSEEDLVDDIVHEIAHSLEERNSLEIYGDGQLEREFIVKRLQLFGVLRGQEVSFFPRDFFINSEYSQEFDDFLYKTIGYALLTSLTVNMFISPYGATSLREYFANAFENYFLGKYEEVKSISPIAYLKIKNLVDLLEDKEYGNF